MSETASWKVQRGKAIKRDGGCCQECGADVGTQSNRDVATAHVHHKQPRSEGGTNDPSNLVTLCTECHQDRHSHGVGGPQMGYVIDSPVGGHLRIDRETELTLNAFETHGYATTGYLVEEMGLTRPTLGKRLDRLYTAGCIEYVHEPTAFWRLVEDPRERPEQETETTDE